MTSRPFAILALCAILTASCTEGSESVAIDPDAPRIHTEKTEHDFGSVFAGARRDAEFIIENRGSRPLQIARALKDCGCTQPVFSSRSIEPGGRAVMTVTLVAPIFHGYLNKRIRVFTNDPQQEETVFRLKVACLGQAHVRPDRITLGNPTVMDSPFHRVPLELSLPEGSVIQSVTAKGDNPFVRADLLEGRGEASARVELVFSGMREERTFKDLVQLAVSTRDARGKEVIIHPQGIQVVGALRPHVPVDGGLMNLGFVESGARRALTARLSLPRDVTIESVEVSASLQKQGDHTLSDDGTISLEVILPEHPGRLFATVRVRLTDRTVVEIPVMGWVEQGV